jgi:hypothetical protein
MFRKEEVPKLNVHSIIPQFPHCDARVLHAPKTCDYCDQHPEWQALRVAWGIAFTGWTPEGSELPCPADHSRGDNHKLWGGNVARKE